MSNTGKTMTETNNAPVPPPPPPTAEEMQAELDRSRSRNKALKITLFLLVTLLVLAGIAAYTVYRKIVQTKEAVEEAFQSFPQQAMFRAEGTALPRSGPSVFSSTPMPSSSLGLFSGGLPGGGGGPEATQAQAAAVLKAMDKYANRPLVKEFIADLKKNPDMAKAFADGQGGDPIAMINGIRGAKGMDKIIAKYAMRPEFLKLMMEVANDPEMAAVTNAMPGAMRPNIGGPVQPRSIPGPGTAAPQEPADQDGDGEMTFDPSAISGTPAPAPAKPAAKTPPPVDTE